MRTEKAGRKEGEPPPRADLPPTRLTIPSELLRALSGNSLQTHFLKISFNFSITVDIQYYFTLVSGVQHSG